MELEHRDKKLKQLALYLRGLPSSLVINDSFSRYNFQNFSPDPDWIDIIGNVEGAVNRELEVRLGSRANGPIEFLERGPAVEALVDVLNRYTKEFPNDGLLKLWIDDALAGAVHTYSKANIPVSIPHTVLWVAAAMNTYAPDTVSSQIGMLQNLVLKWIRIQSRQNAVSQIFPDQGMNWGKKRLKGSDDKAQTKLTNMIKTNSTVHGHALLSY
jgi:hypothetical protein